MLSDILVSVVRVRIIKLFLQKGASEFFHIREITRQVGTEINAVRRELDRLTKVGFLKREPRGNRVYFRIKSDSSLFSDLQSMVAKETGLGEKLLSNISGLGNIKLIFISKPFYSGRLSKSTEVDLFVLGRVDLTVLDKIVKGEESRIGQEINYTVLTEEEFEFLKKRRDNLIINILLEPRLVIYGNEEKYTKLRV